jgi:hypothetical protein
MAELSWHDYQALCWHYNDLNASDDDAPEPISAELYERHLEQLARNGKLQTH